MRITTKEDAQKRMVTRIAAKATKSNPPCCFAVTGALAAMLIFASICFRENGLGLRSVLEKHRNR